MPLRRSANKWAKYELGPRSHEKCERRPLEEISEMKVFGTPAMKLDEMRQATRSPLAMAAVIAALLLATASVLNATMTYENNSIFAECLSNTATCTQLYARSSAIAAGPPRARCYHRGRHHVPCSSGCAPQSDLTAEGAVLACVCCCPRNAQERFMEPDFWGKPEI